MHIFATCRSKRQITVTQNGNCESNVSSIHIVIKKMQYLKKRFFVRIFVNKYSIDSLHDFDHLHIFSSPSYLLSFWLRSIISCLSMKKGNSNVCGRRSFYQFDFWLFINEKYISNEFNSENKLTWNHYVKLWIDAKLKLAEWLS